MFRSTPLSSETDFENGIYELDSHTVLPVSRGTDVSDAKSVKTAISAVGNAPLLGKPGGKSGSVVVTDGAVPGSDSDDGYPEGGIRAWLVVLGCWLGLFASLGFVQILATFQAYLSPAQPVQLGTGPMAGAIFGYASLSLLLGIYVGPLFDKYGPRWLVLAGTVCLVASLLFASTGTDPWHLFLALGVLSSLGTSLLFTPSIAAIGHFFHDRRGLATGIATTAGPFSGVVFPYILQALFVRVGWVWAVRALALICLAITAAANVLIRARLTPTTTTPSKDTTTTPKANTTTTPSSSLSPHPHARILRTRGFTPTVLAVILAQFAAFLPLSYLTAYALSRGLSQSYSSTLVAVLNASSLVGRVAAGFLADRYGAFNVSALGAAVAALACFCVWIPAGGTVAGMAVFVVLFGFVSGGGVTLVPVAVGRLCDMREYGRYYGACYTIASLAVLFAIPIAESVVKDNRGNYWSLVALTGLLYVAAAAAFVVARASVVGWRLWVAV